MKRILQKVKKKFPSQCENDPTVADSQTEANLKPQKGTSCSLKRETWQQITDLCNNKKKKNKENNSLSRHSEEVECKELTRVQTEKLRLEIKAHKSVRGSFCHVCPRVFILKRQ